MSNAKCVQFETFLSCKCKFNRHLPYGHMTFNSTACITQLSCLMEMYNFVLQSFGDGKHDRQISRVQGSKKKTRLQKRFCKKNVIIKLTN